MHKINENVLPPLLSDKVVNMLNKKNPFHVRSNIYLTLMSIQNELDQALAEFRRDNSRSISKGAKG